MATRNDVWRLARALATVQTEAYRNAEPIIELFAAMDAFEDGSNPPDSITQDLAYQRLNQLRLKWQSNILLRTGTIAQRDSRLRSIFVGSQVYHDKNGVASLREALLTAGGQQTTDHDVDASKAHNTSTANTDPPVKSDVSISCVGDHDTGEIQLNSASDRFTVPDDQRMLFAVFACFVARGAPDKVVPFSSLNAILGDSFEHATSALRTAISRLNAKLSEWCETPDGGRWIDATRGSGYFLNKNVTWSIADPALKKHWSRSSQSVFGLLTGKSEEETPDHGTKLPARSRNKGPKSADREA